MTKQKHKERNIIVGKIFGLDDDDLDEDMFYKLQTNVLC